MKLPHFASRLNIALAAMLLCQVQALSASDDYMVSLGKQYFDQGQYQDAANIMAIASSERPRDPYVHYIRANALAKLKQNAEAAAEYRLCLTLDPSGTIGRYSQQALANLIPQPKKPKSKPVSDATTAEVDEATRQKLTAECDAAIDKVNKEASDKRNALEKEKQARLLVNGQPLDKLAVNQVVEKEYGEKIAAVQKEEMDKVAAISSAYARKLATLKRP